jgi:hypothetical protein
MFCIVGTASRHGPQPECQDYDGCDQRCNDQKVAIQTIALASAAAMALPGCVSLPTTEELLRPPAPHLAADAQPGIVDGRGEFRQLFCASLEEHPEDAGSPVPCDFWLYHLEDEPPGAPVPHPLPTPPLQVVLVTGAFSECFGDEALPFGSAVNHLRDDGYRIDTIVVGGRSGTEHNARQIADFLGAWPVQRDLPLVLIGYSKGTSDILQFLVDFPEQRKQVDAVVSVAGSIGGSPLADEYDGLYELLFSHLPSGHCPPGDGDVVHSLRTEVRDQWLRDNALPATVDYYSIAAFTDRERVARALVFSWETLLKYGRRNDGQLLVQDALVPGSTLLGYLHADHWAVALDIEAESPLLAHREESAQFPHLAFLDAVLHAVSLRVGQQGNAIHER